MDAKKLAEALTEREVLQVVAHFLLQDHVKAYTMLAAESTGEEKADNEALLKDKSLMIERVQTVFNDSFSDRVIGLVAYEANKYLVR